MPHIGKLAALLSEALASVTSRAAQLYLLCRTTFSISSSAVMSFLLQRMSVLYRLRNPSVLPLTPGGSGFGLGCFMLLKEMPMHCSILIPSSLLDFISETRKQLLVRNSLAKSRRSLLFYRIGVRASFILPFCHIQI